MKRTILAVMLTSTVLVAASVRGKDSPQLGAIRFQDTANGQSTALPNRSRLTLPIFNRSKTVPVRQVTTESFEQQVLRAPRPVVVDFYATWCPPCKMLAPVLDRLATEYAGRVKVVKVNVDEDPVLAQRLRVSGVPTMVFFSNGRPVDQVVGVPPTDELQRKLDRLSTLNTAAIATN